MVQATFPRRNDQNTPLCNGVTITDPAHPLFGQTLPVVHGSSPRSKSHLIVSLPNGDHRSVPHSVTDFDDSLVLPPNRQDLPRISVRTILPVARFIRERLRAMEEKHDESVSDSTDRTREANILDGLRISERLSPTSVESDRPGQSPATGSMARQSDRVHPAPEPQDGGQRS
jgi:hypothetical protein